MFGMALNELRLSHGTPEKMFRKMPLLIVFSNLLTSVWESEMYMEVMFLLKDDKLYNGVDGYHAGRAFVGKFPPFSRPWRPLVGKCNGERKAGTTRE